MAGSTAPKCVNCGRVERRNHCPECGGCKVLESHRNTCSKDQANNLAGR